MCGEGFTRENAQVVCRENAQLYALTYSSTPLLSQRRQYSIKQTAYTCYGTEQSLCNCPQNNFDCETDMIAVVECNLPGMKH